MGSNLKYVISNGLWGERGGLWMEAGAGGERVGISETSLHKGGAFCLSSVCMRRMLCRAQGTWPGSRRWGVVKLLSDDSYPCF